MELRQFGKTDMQVSVLGFGGAEIGFADASAQQVDELFGAALDAGMNVVDTSAYYLGSEEKIGQALRGKRDRCLLFTKCGLRNPEPASPNPLIRAARGVSRRIAGLQKRPYTRPDWHPRLMGWQIDRSLRRLETDRIDLMQLHSCSEEVLRQGEVIQVLQSARQAGKVRYIGYSGDGAAALYAIQCGHFDALQTSINIADQEPLELTLPLARERGMGLIAKRPIANGVWMSKEAPESIHNITYWKRFKQLDYDFLKAGAAFETALRFTLSAPGVHTAIVGTTSSSHWKRNAESAAAGPLEPLQFSAIRERWKAVAKTDWVGQM